MGVSNATKIILTRLYNEHSHEAISEVRSCTENKNFKHTNCKPLN